MTKTLKKTWFDLEFFQTDHWLSIKEMMKENCDGKFWAPHNSNLFRAFLCSPRFRTKVIMLGSGLRSRLDQADGLLYSTTGLFVPSETEAIFDELKYSMNFKSRPTTGNLTPWARQGVLMLDVSLSKCILSRYTTDDDIFQSDFWDPLMLEVLYEGGIINQDMVFVLIGDKARELGAEMSITGNFRCIELDEPRFPRKGAEPSSPETFVGSDVFNRINKHLKSAKQAAISWSLPGCNKY